LQIVQLMASDPRIDPAATLNAPIRFAAQNGHLFVVQLLLKDSRVNPADKLNYAVGKKNCSENLLIFIRIGSGEGTFGCRSGTTE
jgi:hypothetical protein